MIFNQVWVDKGGIKPISGWGRTLGWDIRPDTNDNGEILIYGQDVSPMWLYKDDLSSTTFENDSTPIKDQEVNPHVDFHYLYFENDNVVWAGTDGGVYRGEIENDSTIKWEVKNNGLGVSTVEYIDAYSNETENKYIVTSGQFDCGTNIYESTGGADWSCKHISGGDGFQTSIVNSNNIYVSSQNRIKKYNGSTTTDLSNGVVWDCGNVNDTLKPLLNFDTYFDRIGDTIYANTSQGIVKHNTQWQEWSEFYTSAYPELGCTKSGTWQIDAHNSGVKYLSTFGASGNNYYRIYKQTNENKSDWVQITGQPDTARWISAIHIGSTANELLVGMRGYLFKVNTSNMVNPTWTDITFDLPNYNYNLVIGAIEYTSDRIWIGTDIGVYYLETNDTTWTDYTTNLPNCEVKDLKVNDDKVYVGTYGRGVWVASTPDCYVSGSPLRLESDTIIQAPATETYKRDVIVPQGITLTVLGTVRMGADCRIIVERGAKLFVDGGTITNACPDMWWGIEVQGNPTRSQSQQYQGWVELDNALIENSQFGIYGCKMEGGATFLDFAGGVIQATDSYFKNNVTDVQLFPYPEPYSNYIVDSSFFTGCNFITDSTFYFFRTKPNTHIHLFGTGRIMLQNNNFQNYCSLSFASEENRGKGIYSIDGSFYAVRGIGENEVNTFNGLEYGVKTLQIVGANIKIDSCEFNHNQTGVYMSGNTWGQVTRNTFNVTRLDGQPADHYCGLYLDACTGFQVEENEFYSCYYPLFGSGYSRSIGLVVNNSGHEDNLIYKNFFHNMSWATIAQNKNRQKGGLTGLQYKCNEFINNYSDIAVTWDPTQPNSMNGIAQHQGSADTSSTAPASNLFSQIGKTEFSDFDNKGEYIWYHMPNWSYTFEYKIKPEFYDTSTMKLLYNNAISNWDPDEIGCPSNLTGRTNNEYKELISVYEGNREIFSDSLDTMVDDGNTTALNLDVVTSLPPETMELRDQLMAASPYLSDTVMLSASEKEDVLPNSIITEILTANPQSARAENVLSNLSARNDPPDESQMASIHANDTVIGNKGLLESKRAFYTAKKHQTVNSLVRLYMNDYYMSDINDSIEAGLSNILTPNSYYLQAFCRLNDGDSLGVLNKLGDVRSDFYLSDYESDMLNAFEDFFSVLLALQAVNKQIAEIDSAQKKIISSIMYNSDEALQANCRNILIHADNLVYHEPYYFPDLLTIKSANAKIPFSGYAFTETKYIKLYPKPATDYITLDYQLPYVSDNVFAEILTIKGIPLERIKLKGLSGQKIIDLRPYGSGTFILRIWSDSRVLQSEKFIKF